MKTQTPVVTNLKDYTPFGFEVETIDLHFQLDPAKTKVRAALNIKRTEQNNRDLFLDGEDIKLENITILPTPKTKLKFKASKTGLTIFGVPDKFTLVIDTVCNPSKNTSLMGLYVSGGRFCTQCEAQGFRRITYFPDRPDVLSKYRVRIDAPKDSYPTLLANGNCIEEGAGKNGEHYAVWEDPFPKPCYLFALVAGKFDIVSDTFTTMSARTIPLDIYVDPGDAPRAQYAMDALKRSMKWDEEAFGREYDLDRFMVVAVRDFNFGAMENKGLNIFNSSLLLADEASATDMNYELIESVIAHEYFHNWSGNRITCRDWFQLCLKEGFTVFRDQEFSADMRGVALQRIKDVKALRARQFAEDAGPLAHPVRPTSYMKIDNFYTATIYEKGAELVRMLKTMLGADTFRKGCDYYFDTYDGTAATVEDFITSFETVSGEDLSQFMLWYEQAGTPHVQIKTHYDEKARTFNVEFTQATPPSPGQPVKHNLLIPVTMGLIGPSGNSYGDLMIKFAGKSASANYDNVPQRPALSVFRGFSAPVIIDYEQPIDDRLRLMKYDPDLFNRWEAGQALGQDILCDLSESVETGTATFAPKTAKKFVNALGNIMAAHNIDDGFKALSMTLPSGGAIMQALYAKNAKGSDPLAIHQAAKALRRAIGEKHENALRTTYDALSQPVPFSPDAAGAGRRSLRNTCLSLLAARPNGDAKTLAQTQFETATNMSDELAALLVLVRMGGQDALDALSRFYDKWKENPLVVDKWFAASAQLPGEQGFAHIQKLTEHAAYKGYNPNRVRSLIGGFAAGNTERFHSYDGAGYHFYADNILKMDKKNPQVAARLLGAFEIAGKLDTHRQSLIKTELISILDNVPSANVLEIATKSLEE